MDTWKSSRDVRDAVLEYGDLLTKRNVLQREPRSVSDQPVDESEE